MDDKIKRYSSIKYTLAIVDIVFLLLLLAILQFSGMAIRFQGWLARYLDSQFLLIFLYCLVLFLFYFILNLPLRFLRTYIIEHRFGLSTQNFFNWLSEQIKEFLVAFFIFIIFTEGFFYFLRNYPLDWWWISAIFWIFFSVIIAVLSPVLIIPLFFKYKRITDEALRQKIINLASKMGVRILDVCQIDFSKKTKKANAALVGLGGSKRVILTDTLQGKFSPEEIEVILAHEFAHYRLKHLIKLLIINSGVILFMFYFFSKYDSLIFGRFNLEPSDIASLSIWIIAFVFFQICLTPLLNWVSRNMERNADRLAIKFSNLKDAFVSMMLKLSEQNLVEQRPAGWIKFFFFDHPPVEERIALARGVTDADK